MNVKPILIASLTVLLSLVALAGYSEQPVPALKESSLILAQGPQGPHGPRGQQGPPPGRGPARVEQVPRLTKEVVKEMLGKPDVVIVDVRYIKQYEESDKKLPGAVFVQPENFDDFVKKHPQKDKTYILY
jgi:3-mercaptopyruvate sulfurtransferase SseA